MIYLILSIKIVIYYKDKVQEVSLTSCIEETILSARGNKIKEASSMDRDNTERILSSELEMSKYIVEEKTEVAEKTQEQSNTEEKEEIKHAETGLKTEVVDNSNISNNDALHLIIDDISKKTITDILELDEIDKITVKTALKITDIMKILRENEDDVLD